MEKQLPPSDLCNKCGRCCRCIISYYTELELKKLDNEETKLFLSFFKKYESIKNINPIDKEFIKSIYDSNEEQPDIWYCPYLDENNECSIYEDRPDFCRTYPKNGWIMTSSNCAYRGWQFEQREKQKKIIRKLKEQLLILKTNNLENSDNHIKLKELEKKIKDKIMQYRKYGADNW